MVRDVTATTDPIDRSICPIPIINTIPTERTTIAPLCRVMFKRLRNEKNVPPNHIPKSKSESKNKANSEYENEYVYNNINIDSKEGDVGEGKEDPAPEKRSRKFTPPTYDEVETYCRERENGIDAIEFVDFYTTNGWKQKGGNPIKDWKACVRTWERNGIRPNRNGTAAETTNATGKPSSVQGHTTETRTRRSTI